MENNASATLLAQYTAADAVANTVYTAQGLQAEITRVIVCNTSASPVAFSLFHDNSGSVTHDATTALYFGKSVAANDSFTLEITGPNGGIHIKSGGTIGFADDSGGDLTLSLYGITQLTAGRR